MVTAGALVVAALVAWGAYALHSELRTSQPVLVITDDTMGAETGPLPTQTSEQTAVTSAPTTSTDEVDVTVPVSQDVLQIRFLDLWERLAAAAGIDANDANLGNFRVFFDYPSGSLVRLDLQVLTRDGYSLAVSYSEAAEGLRMHGNRLRGHTPYLGPYMSLHALFSTLDLVGMKSLLARLDIPKTAKTELYTGDDVTGVEIHLADRSDQGIVEIGGQVRAYYFEAGTWVRLDPDDARRTAGKADIVLVLRRVRENPNALYQDDFASFVIPARHADGVTKTSSDAAEPVGQWTVPADTASLTGLWSQAASEWSADLSDAELTYFMGLWNSDGTIHYLQLEAQTPAGLAVSITAGMLAGSGPDPIDASASLADYSSESHSPDVADKRGPSVTEVLASLDAASVEALASAASIAVADGEFFALWLSRDTTPQGSATLDEAFGEVFGRRYYSVKAGVVSSLEGTTILSSLAPAQHLLFAKAKRNSDGGIQSGVDNSIVHVFVG